MGCARENFFQPLKMCLNHSEHFWWAWSGRNHAYHNLWTMYNPSPMVSGLLDDPPPPQDCKTGQSE